MFALWPSSGRENKLPVAMVQKLVLCNVNPIEFTCIGSDSSSSIRSVEGGQARRCTFTVSHHFYVVMLFRD